MVFVLGLCLGFDVAQAGMPIDEERTCPIGGQTITITGSPSCSFMGQTMDGRPITSCDFVTLIPDCTDTGLPLYKSFDKEELAALETLLAREDFREIREDSRFERAYWLERRLRPDGPYNLALFILLDAYRDDPGAAETGAMTALESVARSMAEDQVEDPATLLALSNVAAWHAYAGRPDKASEWLDQLDVLAASARGAAMMKVDEASEDEALEAAERNLKAVTDFARYGDVLRDCLDQLDEEGCRAEDKFKS